MEGCTTGSGARWQTLLGPCPESQAWRTECHTAPAYHWKSGGCLSHGAMARTSPRSRAQAGGPQGLCRRQDRAEGEFSAGLGAPRWLWAGLAGFGCCESGQCARELERFVGWRAWLHGMSCSIPWIWQPQSLRVPLPTWSKPFGLSGSVPVSLKSHLTQADDHF